MGGQHSNIEVSALQMNESKTSQKRSFSDSLGDFDFATGAKRTLTEQDHDKAKYLAVGIDCAPVSLQYIYPMNQQKVNYQLLDYLIQNR
ncbi:hypothetical protein INT45_007933 [Circinella minor]|uniref:Uncharacterized protein n=1 Tax=Circinella minor TaxID=1195481 RepID=A0A8H7S9X7_9FUNG|nr:hypothetical protein INT45_007933 [Circinella minor]